MRGQLQFKSIMSIALFVFVVAAVLFPSRGCNYRNMLTLLSIEKDETLKRNLSIENMHYFVDGHRIKSYCVSSKNVKDIGTIKGEMENGSFIRYYPEMSKIIYESKESDEKELHEKPIKGKAFVIDKGVNRIFPANKNGSVFYTKGLLENKLYYYEDSKHPRYLGVDNVVELICNETDTLEVSYGVVSSQDKQCHICIGRVDSSGIKLIDQISTSKTGKAVLLSRGFLIYLLYENESRNGKLCLFNRKTKDYIILARDVRVLDAGITNNNAYLAMSLAKNELDCLSILCIDLTSGLSHNIKTFNKTSVFDARFSPTVDCLVYMDKSCQRLYYHNISNNRTDKIIAVSNSAIRKFVFAENGKYILYVVDKLSIPDENIGQSIFSIQPDTGKRSLVYKQGNSIDTVRLHIIEESQAKYCIGQH